MNLLQRIFVVLLISFSSGIYACEVSGNKAFPTIALEGGAIVFEYVSIEAEPEGNGADKDVGIDVGFIDCNGDGKKLIGQLPFLADMGKVRAAFFADTRQGEGNKFFVLHSVEIRSDTGVKYLGDYYNVLVYRKVGSDYVQDDRLTKYFGSGGDVLGGDDKKLVYVFPYKTQSSILKKLASESYKAWSLDAEVNLVIKQRSSLHDSPVLADITSLYLSPGDRVKQESVEAGWLSIAFKAKDGKVVRGWIQCADADGC